jgi:aminoglycoside phosphotransferase (APT) family kinase protein
VAPPFQIMQDDKVLQGAVGQVRRIEWKGRSVVEKRFADAARHDVEVVALRALANQDLPVPELLLVRADSILMTLMPGDRVDSDRSERRVQRLRVSGSWLRRLHSLPAPVGLPPAPNDADIIARYRDAGGPPLPLVVPPKKSAVFCHGDWTAGNLLTVGSDITAVLDWEAAHLGDPLRELARAAWGSSLDDERSADALIEGYGADPAAVRAWFPIHAAELWLWFTEAGPPEYLEQLTRRLNQWPKT